MAYATTNPFTGKVEKEFPTATREEVEAAITKADETFQEWKDRPISERVKVLAKAAEILKAERHEYAKVLTTEMGKLIGEAELEVDLCVGMLEYYVEKGEDLLAPEVIPAKGFADGEVKAYFEPLGVIYAVEPWNFPYYQVIRIGAPQFTAGNTIVLKHASIVPQSALKMEELFKEAGAPDGLLVNVFASHDATDQILSDPRVRGVALTGSEPAGAAVSGTASKYVKKSTLELGGADAFIVLDDAEVEKAAKWAAFGRHWNGGQVCCSSKRLIVVDSLYDRFLEVYRDEVKKFVLGDPMDPATTLAPLSSASAVEGLKKQVEAAKARDGVKVEEFDFEVPETGNFFPPILMTEIPAGSETSREEFFGPVTQLYRVKDEAEAIEVANSSPFGLGGSVFTSDKDRFAQVARKLDTGMVYWNQPTGVKADVPFGGTKLSGFGRELIEWGLKEFVNQKVVVETKIDGSF
ncbi:succinate-semialdehyde dehydrogenase/glutarate-semialdehyde dehydrogenase [Arcanobacterium wilhelmae]|uniref:Succinate-semialdehyde dehydrogenase/glutarate-semialdehyde dehydrogenase n=1 Tax=Arcanobacterium wilhelmae TaxID=1803177 RepID=A0ABT9ND10_9ACTO|nr:NAD-dependent succinate-semialdehyde dehydrogenase [Arcanobacterium wilhelmae]MDP9801608.1 succinate-semialdehyde dehydrogenase/glutarate-semialdehyde dehydrogenase [Arcanobacterium wilhelmae]WFN90931.1 NAD-dependent succinate-semialdehyde dehydrogenase [Arcanobacterium wilhelmae]